MRYLCLAVLALASQLSGRPLAEDVPARTNPILATTAEFGGALVGSAATFAVGAGLVYFGASPVGYGVVALTPAAAAGGARLVGGWLDRGGSYWWSVMGAYGGLVPGVLVGAGINALYPPQDLWDVTGKVAIGMYIGANIGAVIGYKLSRRSPELDESRLRLDPPSLALSLKPAKPGALPEIAGLRLNLLSARF